MRSPLSTWMGVTALSLFASLLAASCIATDSGLGDATQGCEEFKPGATFDDSVHVNGSVRLFMQASGDFRAMSENLTAAVREACAGIAEDLGARDSWSNLDGNASISNSNGTGACDVASARISAIMEASVSANFALVETRGDCHPDFKAQTECDAKCAGEAKCDSGTIETRCDPAALSVQCQGSCNVDAYCEGTVDRPANCMGACESTCEGECKGACVTADGTRTDNDPNCHGKCSSSCNGTCRGLCKVEPSAGIDCGEQVSCRGGCTGSYTAPECTTLFTPPRCTVDQACLDSCSAEVAKNAVCDPPRVQLTADVSASADVKLLVDTVNAHLPALLDIADAKGQLAAKAIGDVVDAGKAVVQSSGDLDGKSIACAAAAVKASVEAAAMAEVSVDASSRVTDSCNSHTIR